MRAGPRRNVRNHGGGKGRPLFGGLLSRGASRFRLEELEELAINPQGKNANRGMERRIFSRRKSARIQRATTGRFRGACSSRGGCNLSKRAPVGADGDALHKLQVVGCFLRGSPAAAKLNIKMPRISGRSDTDPGRLHEGRSVPCTIATRFIDETLIINCESVSI